ncbi:hypothetical protein [Actibacterium sp. XHP0104]|uniref:hypothetical protein n=1 Tax=Actibacterium sp. XHP0104 TaxID=2984335 RepID=UPI0021E9AB65|nr:hypothetical protein [Actibacterium sp. XHP0104]MCV2880924.1 hypothetical protein [Actibacterium sp. XHP0104]
MSEQKSCNRATIMFDGLPRLDFVELATELQRPFRNIALEFEQTAVAEDSHVMFISESMVVRVGHAAKTEWSQKFAKAKRPSQGKVSAAMISTLLEDVHSAIEVTIEDGPSRTVSPRTRIAACYHVVRHLLRNHQASLVHWDLSDTLFTTEEFENPTAMMQQQDAGEIAQARRTRRSAVRSAARPALDGFSAAARTAFAGADLEVDATHARLDRSFVNAVNMRDAGEATRQRLRETYEDSDQHEARLRSSRNNLFADDLIRSRDSRRPPPREEIGLMEQLAVYLMTVTIMILSFPAGFAMLVYTVLRGENLNMTARAMALTGIGVGCTSPAFTQALMQLV